MLEYLRRQSAPPTTLLEIIAAVRSRWRLKLALRGALAIAVIGFALFLLTAYGLQWARFSGASIVLARVLMIAGAVGLVAWFLVKPLRRRVTDEQVAMYLEEHEPTLQATLLSAVETSREGHVPESAALVRRVIEQAIEAVARMDAANGVERIPLRRYAAATGATALVALLAVLLGPAFLRHAMTALVLIPSVQAASPYKIDVTPGDITVPKGADQKVAAVLSGFNSEDVSVMVKRTPSGSFEPVPMARNNETGKYEGMVFDILAALDYYVIADGVVSKEHHMKVVEVPYVQRLELEYHFPAYTGLEPQKIEDGGDVAVLRGSEVRVHIFPTMKTGSGRISLNDKESVPLKIESDGTFTAAFKADQDGFYRVEFDAPNGEHVIGSPQFTIDVLADQPPTVTFNKPGRDTSVSPIEEVFTEANVVDDYGVKDLELVYSVNGGPEKVLKLFNGTKRLPEVAAGHTFYLEELNVKPGDAVSYYARATDNDAVSGAKQTSSDLYFLRIRPFKKDFRQAQSQGGGGGGGGGGAGQVEALSEQQRQIISATFNVQRDRKKLTSDKLRENSTVVSLSQSRLREQVEGLLTRINSQLIERDPAFAKIGELLPQAVTAMKEAEGKLSAAAPDQALPPENKALQILQTAEEEYETQVQVSRQQGGGGGGGGQVQQELAALFEQELNKMASRYETASQASEQNRDREVDELLEKLKELARRQEQEAERQRRRAIEGQQSGGGSGAQQRALADQVEEAARRLERLSREEQRPELAEAARQMREAADAMRRAAAGGDASASAQAQAALERLRETEKKLQRSLTQRAQRDIDDAKRQADALAREQQEIVDQVKQLPASPQARAQQANRINERKDALETKLGELEGNLDRAARDASREERQASRKMSEAAGAIRDNRLRDAVKYSKALVSRGSNQQANAAEGDIARGIEEVRQRLEEAQASLGQGKPGDKKQEAAERAQRLARGAESLQERTRERAQANRGDQGKQGQQGKEGQQGQGQQGQGQQGKEGQQGQGGQQGQNGQGGQGQQGQQGQGGQRGDGQNGGNRGGLGDRADAGGFGGGYDRGAWRGDATWGGWWEGGRLTAEDMRQLSREARQYANDAQQLRGLLRGENIDPKELDEIIKNLQQLQDERVYQNVQELARLQAYVAEGLKRFEFSLRRQVKADAGASALTGSDEVPEEFKALVEQYYKSLAKSPR
jgi:uncharacterized protein DUF4175